MSPEVFEFLTRRAVEERAAAAATVDPRNRAIHLANAAALDDQIRAIANEVASPFLGMASKS
jgi:hypothetical protein